VNAWNPIFELLPHEPKMLPLNENVSKVKLKLLLVARRYAHLKPNDDFFVVSPSKLNVLQRGNSPDLLNDFFLGKIYISPPNYHTFFGWHPELPRLALRPPKLPLSDFLTPSVYLYH
jgi:hypothetical protein